MSKQTIYDYAGSEMTKIVVMLLDLASKTQNFTQPPTEMWTDPSTSEMLLCGKGYAIEDLAAFPSAANAWLGRLAVPFSIELAATGTLYQRIKIFTDQLIEFTYDDTNNFKNINPEWISKNPQSLPVLMHVSGTFSKQGLKKQIGSASDNSISKPAAAKLAAMMEKSLEANAIPDRENIRVRIKGTVEGIVRDLVGRMLLEEFVASALARHDVPFKRENQYSGITGVVYDFRADFVVPHETTPLAFLEVRKSSSRHASLYAKDKMFSAINWKGQHPECLGILITDGPWTDVTLKIMSRIFDYVIPINQVDEVAAKIRSYLNGDKSVLQWLVYFKIMRVTPEGPVEVPKVQISPDDLTDDQDAD